MLDIETLGRSFERFARLECQNSPLYQALALGIAGDGALLELARPGDQGPKPNLFLAAVHYLLLNGVQHPLAGYYPTLAGPRQNTVNLSNTFRAFCLDHADQIRDLMITRRVQTNEVRRAAVLLPVFNLISQCEPGRWLALIEVGASAGLLLSLDKYGYDYGSHGQFGIRDSPIQIECAVRGDVSPPLTGRPLPVTDRIGIDLHPVDVRDPDEALWLSALVWGDQPERLTRLHQAIEITAQAPPRLITGDAVEMLPLAFSEVAVEAIPCVFHCHTLNQFSPDAREQFENVLIQRSAGRRLYRIALEAVSGDTDPHLMLSIFEDGRKTGHDHLANYHAHGEWIEWLQPDQALGLSNITGRAVPR